MSSQNYSGIHAKGKILIGKSEYMFWGIFKKNSGFRLRRINKPITYTSVREDVLRVLKKLGLSSEITAYIACVLLGTQWQHF